MLEVDEFAEENVIKENGVDKFRLSFFHKRLMLFRIRVEFHLFNVSFYDSINSNYVSKGYVPKE